jgi:hypothetical protein
LTYVVTMTCACGNTEHNTRQTMAAVSGWLSLATSVLMFTYDMGYMLLRTAFVPMRHWPTNTQVAMVPSQDEGVWSISVRGRRR